MLAPCVTAGEPLENEFAANPDFDEVIATLVVSLGRAKAADGERQDAALKLGRLGKRSVAMLAELLKNNSSRDPASAGLCPTGREAPATSGQITFYSTLALARIKHGDAAKALLPLLENPKANAELRALAVEAMGLEMLPESGAALQKIATGDPDTGLRKKAFGQLTIMPQFWKAAEKLFVDALSDPDEEIRALAAKHCWYARIYLTATDKLIEMSEKEPTQPARMSAMLALSRMKVNRAVPALRRVCLDAEAPASIQLQALRTITAITGITLKDNAALETWWKKFGEAQFAKLEEAGKAAEPPPAEKAANP